jgi:hypothetical protein
VAARGARDVEPAFDGTWTRCQPDLVIELSEQQIIDQVARRLADAHKQLEPADVARLVHEEYARFDGRPIRDFIPLFVEPHTKKELSKLTA